jgi:hypothetical protein
MNPVVTFPITWIWREQAAAPDEAGEGHHAIHLQDFTVNITTKKL